MSQLVGPNSEKIKAMFSEVAGRYDQANSILSFGIHKIWRKKLVKMSQAQMGNSVLDCATGTGDLAIEFKKAVGIKGKVVGTDFCLPMLAFGPQKAKRFGLDIQWQQADVTQLLFPDQKFDISSIAFGIRNVDDPLKGLKELARVSKAGGRVMVLEFGQVQNPVLKFFYSVYAQSFLPILGGFITGKRQAYQYLQESSATFPCGQSFADLMMQTGQFKNVHFEMSFGGIAYLYRGQKA